MVCFLAELVVIGLVSSVALASVLQGESIIASLNSKFSALIRRGDLAKEIGNQFRFFILVAAHVFVLKNLLSLNPHDVGLLSAQDSAVLCSSELIIGG